MCKDAPSCSGLFLSTSHREKEAPALNDQCESFFNQDEVTNFEELHFKTSDDARDKGFLLHKTEEHCNFILKSNEHPLSIQVTVTVSRCLEVSAYHKQELVPLTSFNHIMLTNIVTQLSEITNL